MQKIHAEPSAELRILCGVGNAHFYIKIRKISVKNFMKLYREEEGVKIENSPGKINLDSPLALKQISA